MSLNILVVDSSEQFATLVQQSLEDSGEFEVMVATSVADAMHVASLEEFRLALVDLELPRNTGLDLLRIWSSQKPEMSLVAVLIKGNEQAINSLDVPIHGVLYKPFYLPDLPAIIQSALASQPVLHGMASPSEPISTSAINGPEDMKPTPMEVESSTITDREFDSVLTAMQQVTDGKQVMAVLITSGGQPWTDLGVLSAEQKHFVFTTVNQVIQAGGLTGEVVRFIDVPGLDEAPLFYLAPLQDNRELSLLLSPFVSIATARQVAQTVTESLDLEGAQGDEEDPGITAEPLLVEAILQGEDSAPSEDLFPEVDHLEAQSPMYEISEPETVTPEEPLRETYAPSAATPLEISPEPVSLPEDWIPEPEIRARLHADHPVTDDSKMDDRKAVTVQPTAVETQIQLPYSLVFIPRFPEHRLAGVLAERIRSWSQRLSIAWDWRMVDLSIEPEYLSVTLQLSPEIPPATVVRTLRHELSEKILNAYPDLASDLPSNRFWATSYLLLAGPAPSQSQIRAFIVDTRKAQGL